MMIPVAWRRVDAVGFERGELANGLDGFRLRGTFGLMEGGDSFDASYEVACDSAWVTQSVTVELRGPKGEKCLRLAKRDGVWLVEGRTDDTLRGCIDIDLGWTLIARESA